jgi:hypothetical protein
MDPGTVAEALRQVLEGDDFAGPRAMTRGVSETTAARQNEDAPYSILINAEHALFWNRIWLARLEGSKRPNMLEDWRTPAPQEWKRIRTELTESVERAFRIASAKPFMHGMKSEDAACRTLLAIAVHTAYHLGQINLLKRIARKSS